MEEGQSSIMIPVKNQILLELHVPDFKKVKQYYGKVGFEVVRETKPEGKAGYLVLEMEGNILCFWAGNDAVYEQSYFSRFPRDTKRCYGVEIIVMVRDIETYFRQVRDFAHVIMPLLEQPWGAKDFRVEDPFGYYIRISSFYNVLFEKDVF